MSDRITKAMLRLYPKEELITMFQKVLNGERDELCLMAFEKIHELKCRLEEGID